MKLLRTVLKRNRLWLIIWTVPFLLLLIHFFITQRDISLSASLQMAFGLFLALGTSLLTPKMISRLLSSSLYILGLLAIIIWNVLPYSWLADENISLSAMLNKLTIVDGTANVRTWQLSTEVSSVSLQFNAQLLDKAAFGWDWLRSSSAYQLSPVQEGETLYTHIISPSITNASLRKSYDLGYATGGHTLKASLAMRSDNAIAEQGCRGIMLISGFQDIGNTGKKCLTVDMTQAWQTYELIWTVPEQVTSSQVHIALTNLAGYTFDVKDTALFLWQDGIWKPLAPLIPDSPYISIAKRNPDGNLQQIAYRGFYAQQENTAFSLPFSFAKPLSDIFVQVHTGEDERGRSRSIKLENFQIITSGVSHKAKHLFDPWELRQSFVFPHANLAGHSIATILLALLVIRPRSPSTLLSSLLALALIWMTGSRTAWLIALTSCSLIYTIPSSENLKTKRRVHYLLALLLVLSLSAILLLGSDYLGRLTTLDQQSQATRQAIWQASWQRFLTFPLLGSPISESLYINATVPNSETIGHAHNLWLEFAVRYGFLGLLAITWLSSSLLYGAWRWGRGYGLILVVAILIMNIFDYSFFYIGVFAPLILGLNTLYIQKTNKIAV